MTEASHAEPYFAIVLKVGPNASGVPQTDGWKSLIESGDAAMLAQFLRRQSPLLANLTASGILVRVATDEDGTEIKPLMDHTGAMRPEVLLTRVPRQMRTADRVDWCNLVESYLQEIREAQPAPVMSDGGRKAILPTVQDLVGMFGLLRTRRAAYATASMAAMAACIGLWSLSSPARAYRMQAQVPMTYGEDLAEGGSVRRLQGVAQAFGRRW